ncbi:U3 small nucleolar RNA-associated protein 14 B isoform 1 [Theobroma cacao]|uniref:U3 small nucleolar RNA-associated protein 14 B isoform 1 n=2 Tax=Theobroma cacao TaxID=3641 RepID=A0A061F7Z0_THECC|nr:U3 small nucleolar RNA-associated protein 14 B isoform 1 [Theobroma cacao]EOY12813.1 U3 small nucleolar RNA-associated protein 14 B isoform 1 [Theobroma cacao]
MTTLFPMSLTFSPFSLSNEEFSGKPFCCYCLKGPKVASLRQKRFKLGAFRRQRWSCGEVGRSKDGTFVKEEGWKRNERVVLVRFNQGFGFNGGGGSGGGGGGGKIDSNAARLLGNIAVAIGLTYLSMTGQLGWVLDAIVSIWLLAVLIPIVGLGAFLWWAGRDIVQSSCPNCGNDFQIFKSFLNDELQLCPYCSQPFSVVDDKFVKEPVKFSNQTSKAEQAFNGFSPGFKKGKDSSAAVVDVEAEVKDAD